MTSVEIFADGGAEVGLGHVRRCLVLAHAFTRAGCICRIATPDSACASIARNEGFDSRVVERDRPLLNSADILLVDGYGLTIELTESWRHLFGHRVVIDDNADRPVACDILVNPNIYGADLDYSGYRLVTLLAGPNYALVNPLFRVPEPGLSRRPDGSILISFGGTDDGKYAEPIVRALLSTDTPIDIVISPVRQPVSSLINLCQTEPGRLRLHHGADIPELMKNARLFIGAAGSMVLEALAARTPIVVCAIADNQRNNITTLARMGVAVQGNFDSDSLAKSATDILNDSNETACTLPDIDCAGQERIVEKVLEFQEPMGKSK